MTPLKRKRCDQSLNFPKKLWKFNLRGKTFLNNNVFHGQIVVLKVDFSINLANQIKEWSTAQFTAFQFNKNH